MPVLCTGRGGAVDQTAGIEFSEFAHGRWPALARLGYGLTGDRGPAEDLAQTALATDRPVSQLPNTDQAERLCRATRDSEPRLSR
jgi:hypothetical protein